jgi:L-ascorbate 6-phosphate lactonase
MTATSPLGDEVEERAVPTGTLAFWWLYQAGLVVKSPGGTVVAIDPYLSDAAFRSYQQSRNVPALVDPARMTLDALLASHSHEDHLDPDSVPGFMANPATHFIGPPMAVDKVLSTGVEPSRTTAARRGDVVEVGDIRVTAVHARHVFAPEPTPDAVGYLLEHEGVRLYHSGDTEYDSEIVKDTRPTTVSFIAINGTAGNMNVYEAAMLAWRQGARLAIPFHYGLWRDEGYGEGATIDPQVFVDTYHRLDPDGETLVLSAGRQVLVDADGLVP